MGLETKQCQNCQAEFTIESGDFEFYKKIGVPEPTWCPECRFIRRYIWRNERALYRRKCDAPGHAEEMVSMYAPDKRYVVYDEKYWWSDAWDPLAYGVEYDFTKPFFTQYEELLRRVPLIGLSVTNNTDSNYCNVSAWDKGCYMVSASGLNEDSFYSNRVANTKSSCDVYISDRNQFSYELVECSNCYKTYFSSCSRNCMESYFLYDCVNCQNCFGCVGLRNKSYHIYNQPYTKEEYEQRLKEFNLESFSSLSKAQVDIKEFVTVFPRRFANIINCTETTGDNAENCKAAKLCFDATNVEDSKFLSWVYAGVKDSYDVGAGSGLNVERLYECWDTNQGSSRVYFSGVIYSCFDTYYSWNCHNSHHLFGCYGLRNKEYCILNKQYSKEEYEDLVKKITKHMNSMPFAGKNGRVYMFGEFMPLEISPFAYNETIAQDYFTLTEVAAKSGGYEWHELPDRNYNVTVRSTNLPDKCSDAGEEVAKEIISCAHEDERKHPFSCEASCTKAFRFIPAEIQFYRNSNLPIPHLCPNCRHYRRLADRNPIKLWKRHCDCGSVANDMAQGTKRYKNTAPHAHGDNPCMNEFETSYSPDRPETIYCESCYNSEVA